MSAAGLRVAIVCDALPGRYPILTTAAGPSAGARPWTR